MVYGLKLEVSWRSERSVGSHSRGQCLWFECDYLWIMPIRSPPTAACFRHRDRALPFSSGAALQSDRGP